MRSGETPTAPNKERRGQNRKGVPATQKQRAAMSKGAKVAAQKRTERKRARDAELLAEPKPRWKKLEDGDITVHELTMDELVRLECSNNDGTWEGRRHVLSSRMQTRMAGEMARRVKRQIHAIGPAAIEALEEMVDDVDNPAQRMKAVQMVIEHIVGKVPDVVHVGAETEWERLQSSAFVTIDRSEPVALESAASEDIVDAVLVEE